MKVTTEKIDGNEIEFCISAEGEFSAYIRLAEQYVKAATLAECRIKARALLRKSTAKIDIKASIVGTMPQKWLEIPNWQRTRDSVPVPDANEVRPITIVGLHPRNRSVLVIYEDTGEKDEFRERSWYGDVNGEICQRLTNDEAKEFKRLYAERKAANNAFDRWMESKRIKRVEDYIEAKVQEKIDAMNAGTDEPEPTEDPRETAPKKLKRRKNE